MKRLNRNCLRILLILSVLICAGCGNADRKYQYYEAKTPTVTVGGLLAYNKNSDMILDISEDYFLNIDKDMIWDELIAEIGEPSGTIGSGMVRVYWRIGEERYAVAYIGTNKISFEIRGK